VAKLRVYELARELGVESKEVLERARDLGIEVKTASSGVDDEAAELVRMSFAEEAGDTAPATAAVEEETSPAEVEAAEPKEGAVAAEPTPEEPEGREQPDEADEITIVEVPRGATVAEFADTIGRPTADVVRALLVRGQAAGAGDPMPTEAMEEIAEAFGVIVDITEPAEEPKPRRDVPVYDDAAEDLVPRPPVVTVMGHVDHGKTTLLDAIRKTNVVATEKGGITQHIGAYQVQVGDHKITFIDTPGHEAFTALRARGAEVTDIVVLVVAADDGVMPQTIEAISHTKAAGVPMVVAINKVDLPGADPFRIRTQLTEHGVIVEELGGDIPSVEVSAVTGDGIGQLLEVIDLIAQLEDFRANPKAPASGVVIESRLDQGMGPVATVIVQRGTLRQGDSFVAGAVAGRVRSMLDDAGQRLKEAPPATPVLIMGWSEVPTAGDHFEVVPNDRIARKIAAERAESLKASKQRIPTAQERLQNLLDQLRTEEAELRVILKADAHGSLEALRDSIAKITREGGHIEVVHGAVGGINENDVTLAEVTDAIIIGFNVRPEGKARRAAESKGIQIRTYGIIYELLDDIEKLLVGELAPEEHEIVLGSAEVRATFKVPRVGTVAGCYVTEGVVQRGARARIVRDGVVIHDGKIGSLRRFKEDVREVASGYECGIGFENFNDVKEGDVIEVYEIREVPRT